MTWFGGAFRRTGKPRHGILVGMRLTSAWLSALKPFLKAKIWECSEQLSYPSHDIWWTCIEQAARAAMDSAISVSEDCSLTFFVDEGKRGPWLKVPVDCRIVWAWQRFSKSSCFRFCGLPPKSKESGLPERLWSFRCDLDSSVRIYAKISRSKILSTKIPIEKRR